MGEVVVLSDEALGEVSSVGKWDMAVVSQLYPARRNRTSTTAVQTEHTQLSSSMSASVTGLQGWRWRVAQTEAANAFVPLVLAFGVA